MALIAPGNPEQSAIIRRIFEPDPSRRMPPAYAHKELTETQKQTIRQWVAEGAHYEEHWSYLPLRRPLPPESTTSDALVRNPVDSFIQQRLVREGLPVSPEADPRTLIRRVSLDLTGLPPTPDEVSAFLNDASPDAYWKLVDRLLNSEAFAEKQATHWLDLVRYADTSGFHGDNPIPIWPYRDYVLRAFRDNKPFDQFTREQLAGDLVPGATLEQRVASAYNRLNRTSAEGGLQPKEYLAKYGADRVRTLSAVWMGSTVGCAECHDHKFDPFTARDFYSMKAFFADILETGFVQDRGPEAWGAKIDLPSPEQQRERERLNWRLQETRRALKVESRIHQANDPNWEKTVLDRFEGGELSWRFQRPASARSLNGAELTIYNDEPVETHAYTAGVLHLPGEGMVVAGGPNPDNETYVIDFKPGRGAWTALGIEVAFDERLAGTGFARGSDRLLVTEVEVELSGDSGKTFLRLPLVLATAATGPLPGVPLDTGIATPEHPPMAAIDGDPKTGWGLATFIDYRNLFLALRFGQAVATVADSVVRVTVRHDSDYRRATAGRLRLALSAAHYSWPRPGRSWRQSPSQPAADSDSNSGLSENILKLLRKPKKDRAPADEDALLEYYQWVSPALQPMVVEAAKLEAALNILEAAIPEVVTTKSTSPKTTRILPRGNWMDDSGEIVEPAVPGFLGSLAAQRPRATRLDLANWLVSPGNPLAARAFVNRQWQHLFGTGLSRVLDDLGSQGELPTHPELLDWLAAELIEPSWRAEGARPWDMKHLIRVIVMSHAYRQSSLSNPQQAELDPDNRLLSRQNRLRLDAEAVRDMALAVSGLLKPRFGGPSVRPYQPEGYLTAMYYPRREYSESRGDDLYRRGLYTFWQRTFLHPSLLTFDASTREECAVARVKSNTPLQALILLNDPGFVETARVFAQNILESGGAGLENRIRWGFERAVTREPRGPELDALLDLHRQNLAQFTADSAGASKLLEVGEAPMLPGADRAELAAMTTVARAILNLHETITRN